MHAYTHTHITLDAITSTVYVHNLSLQISYLNNTQHTKYMTKLICTQTITQQKLRSLHHVDISTDLSAEL